MNKDIRVYLEDIINAMSNAEQFVAAMDYAHPRNFGQIHLMTDENSLIPASLLFTPN